ncbi:hypothetical protein [Asticcacaulis sp. EMRT-3]|uniref:hypothetical protein n=1 Tax=Asticcacaulis sp. EMRT-3 TaxID=3040349 RepID=UPI0024AF739D|nr:hypothetical protein [Asticcacaulis sp. EMRT-3]MDI7774680.1 hypothetical protein [Asticcacaulis sp. EMRT-3]
MTDTATARPPLEALLAERNGSALAQASGSTLSFSSATPVKAFAPKPSVTPLAGGSLLPKGISGGKVAAIVAATAVIGGGIYLATRKKPEQQTSWASRVQAERAATQAPVQAR